MSYQLYREATVLAFIATKKGNVLVPNNLRRDKKVLKKHLEFTLLDKGNLHMELGEVKKILNMFVKR